MQATLERLLGTSRWSRFVAAAGDDVEKAAELYVWHMQVASQIQGLISYLEVALRNAVDAELRAWVVTQEPSKASLARYSPDWCLTDDVPHMLGVLIGKKQREAREYATAENRHRRASHRRAGEPVCHDDVLVQIPFGGWTGLFAPAGALNSSTRPIVIGGTRERLWDECLHRVFQNNPQSFGCGSVGARLESMRMLRNRVAHFDSLLDVDIERQMQTALSLLALIDQEFADIAIWRNPLRTLIAQDPRLTSE